MILRCIYVFCAPCAASLKDLTKPGVNWILADDGIRTARRCGEYRLLGESLKSRIDICGETAAYVCVSHFGPISDWLDAGNVEAQQTQKLLSGAGS
jgi:hypothetical protein